MTDDGSIPMNAFRIGDPLDADGVEDLAQQIRGAFDRAGIDGEIIVFNGNIQPMDKHELRDLLREVDKDD